jgi:hypothetical protein
LCRVPVYLTPIIPRMLRIRLHAMEREPARWFFSPLRWVERRLGGEVNSGQARETMRSFGSVRHEPTRLALFGSEGRGVVSLCGFNIWLLLEGNEI